MKVMTRLQNITYLHTLLEEALSGNPVITGLSQPPVIQGIFKMMCVSGTPGFVPPVANFDGESPDVPSPAPAAPGNKAKRGDIAEVNVFEAVRLLQVAWFAVLFFRKRGEEEKGPWPELFRKQLSAGGRNQWRQNPAGKCGALIVVWVSVTSHLTWGFVAATGATREGEGEREPTGDESWILQSFFQRAGHGSPQVAAVRAAVPLTPRLGATHQRKKPV